MYWDAVRHSLALRPVQEKIQVDFMPKIRCLPQEDDSQNRLNSVSIDRGESGGSISILKVQFG